jgi:hypothetical protein
MTEDNRESWIKSNLMHNLYSYCSYKIIYPSTVKADFSAPQIGSGGPHGVFPLGALLSIPAFNEFLGVPFRGGMASVVSKTPGLRYISDIGAIDVGKKSVTHHIVNQKHTVGIVSDGISGCFANSKDPKIEALAIVDKKGLSRLAMRK